MEIFQPAVTVSSWNSKLVPKGGLQTCPFPASFLFQPHLTTAALGCVALPCSLSPWGDIFRLPKALLRFFFFLVSQTVTPICLPCSMTIRHLCGPRGLETGEQPREAGQRTSSSPCGVRSEARHPGRLPPETEPWPRSCHQPALAQLAGALGFSRMLVSAQGL